MTSKERIKIVPDRATETSHHLEWKPSCFNDSNEWNKRTRGIKINTLVDNDKYKISL
jgi:hypothetical protein